MREPTYAGPRRFETTHWSLVARAGQGAPGDEAAQRRALAELVKRYLTALRVHLIAAKRMDPDRADDLLQAFLAEKVVEQGLVAKARRDRGKFRTFLLTALDRFAVDRVRHERAKKRSAEGVVPVDEELDAADGSQPAPDEGFDIAWAKALLDEALRRMRQECEASGRRDVWGVFEARMLEPLLHNAEPMPYERLVETYNLASPAQASNVLITAKRMFARVLKGLIGEYERDEAQVEAEIADLQRILARAGG